MALKTAFRGGDQDERPGWWLGFGYDQDVVDELKRKVPPRSREWGGAARLWWVSGEYESVLVEIFGASFEVHLNQTQLL